MTMTCIKNSSIRFHVNFMATAAFIYILTFFLTTMAMDSHNYKQESYFIRHFTFDDTYVTDDVLAYFATDSELKCLMSCLTNDQCKSFSYNTLSLFCQHFLSALWTKAVTGTNQNGWQHYARQRDCVDLSNTPYSTGIYTIYPNEAIGFRVKCEMDVDGGGWTFFQQRYAGATDFRRNWIDYKTGFGNMAGEFWLGNDHIHTITSSADYELRIEFTDWEGNNWYAVYQTFKVGDEDSQYMLTVDSYSGNTGDSMSYHNGMKFSTVDRDNDGYNTVHCARDRGGGGWWYLACDMANLNSIGSIEWEALWSNPFTYKFTRMMVRRL